MPSVDERSHQVASGLRRLGVLVVDDREVVHCGIRLVLATGRTASRCVGASSLRDALKLLARYDLQVALVDHVVAGVSGLNLAARLRRAAPDLRVVLMVAGPAPSPGALAYAGVYGCVSRNEDGGGLLAAVERVASGLELPLPKSPSGLSAREVEVLSGLARGWTNAQVADALFVSANTVKAHTRSLYRKLNACSRADAVQRAQRLGLVA